MAPSDTPIPPPAQAPCEETDSLFRTLLDATFEGVLIHDTHIHYANRAACEITGYEIDALLGMRVEALRTHIGCDEPLVGGPPEAHDGATYGPLRFAGSGRTGNAVIEAQGRMVTYQGSPMWLTAFRDVSAHVAAAEAMRKRADFEDLMTSISASFIQLAPEDAFQALASALERIGEFARVDRAYMYLIEGEQMRATSLWMPDSGAHSFDDWTLEIGDFQWAVDLLRRGETVIFEKTESHEPTRHGPGRALPQPRLRSSCCVPMLVGSELLGYVGFDAFRDRTHWRAETVRLLRTVGYIFASVLQRKSVQEQLASAYANMEQEVDKRSRELQQQQGQLMHAEKMASLGQLVAGVAHEINTPLGAIKSNTDTLARALRRIRDRLTDGEPIEAGDAQLLKLIDASEKLNSVDLEATDRIARIVSSLRTFARLDRAERGSIDLHAAIDNTLTLIQHALRHRVEVDLDFGDLPEIECYPNPLNQVIMNLVMNATQAIDQRGRIGIRTRPRGSDAVTLEVSDDGQGIAEEHLGRIFDPGFTTKGVGVGTGLGLSIVHQIVGDHGGTIEVESTPGEGTRFTVTLPVRLPEAEARSA